MMNARRLARWLRLVVACLAFVIAPAPAVAATVIDEIVLVAEDDAREESRVAISAAAPLPDVAVETTAARRFESPRLVSRRWLTNCALLL